MPPHCYSLDGPVVTAAARALQSGNVELVLPYVHPDGEAELREAFARVVPLRAGGDGTGALADRWFYETVVRVHRAGEGAPYTGLKPAGQGWRGLQSGSWESGARIVSSAILAPMPT